MIELFAVVAPPRSGTQWFARLFTTEQSFCYHELSTHLRPFPALMAFQPWLELQAHDHDFEQRQRRLVLQGYPDYFARHWERLNYGQWRVGNSDFNLVHMLPGVWLLWPRLRVLFAARNGINCVQSHFLHRRHWPEDFIRRCQARWQTSDFFTICCRWWAESVAAWQRSKSWLAERNAGCAETRLERVTTDLAELRRLWDWLQIGDWGQHAERNRQMMGNPINARTNRLAVVGPEEVWTSWSEPQRRSFRSLCGEAMRQLGYDLPGK